MLMQLPLVLLFSILPALCSAAPDEIKVATLNCYLLFDPRIDHHGKVDDEEKMTL